MDPSTHAPFDAAIVGGGIAGCSLALALAQQGRRVALMETQPPPAAEPNDLRVFALSPASALLLQRVGVWPHVSDQYYSPYRHMSVWDSGHAPGVRFTADLIGEAQLGWIVADTAIRSAAWKALSAALGITPFCPARVVHVHTGATQVTLQLDDARCLRASLVVAADGIFSPLREWAGIGVLGHAYDQRAVVAHVATELPHRQTAWQCFTSHGPLAYLPLADGRSSIVWSVPNARAEAILRWDDAEFSQQVATAMEHTLGAVTGCTARAAFPLRMQLAKRYAGPRLALVGDAAHVMHPLAGQGLNQGLLDVAALAEVLGAARGDLGDPNLLRAYDRWRRLDAQAASLQFDALEGLFRSTFKPLVALRRYGMRWMQGRTAIKRILAQQASGWGGRIPELMRRSG